MTQKYLKKNNLIRREMRQYNAERFRNGAIVMAIAVSEGAANGRVAERIRNAVMSRKEFQGLTQPETTIALGHYLMNRIENLDLIILQTPLNLCCRPITVSERPPCQRNNRDTEDVGLPDPSCCAGISCDWAVITFDQIKSLDAELVIYQNVLQSIDRSIARNLYLLAHATDFVETYNPICDRIKRVPIEALHYKIEALRMKLAGDAA